MSQRLLCRQENDGVQSGDVFEIVPQDGLSAEEYLERKASSHGDKGWTVTRTPGGLHAFKVYSKRGTPTAPRRKDRYLWLEG